MSVEEWEAAEPAARTPIAPAVADGLSAAVLEGRLGEAEMEAVCELGERMLREQGEEAPPALSLFEGDGVGDVEDFFHAAGEHRVAHLHRHGALQARSSEP